MLGERGCLFVGEVERHSAEMVSAAASGKIGDLNGRGRDILRVSRPVDRRRVQLPTPLPLNWNAKVWQRRRLQFPEQPTPVAA